MLRNINQQISPVYLPGMHELASLKINLRNFSDSTPLHCHDSFKVIFNHYECSSPMRSYTLFVLISLFTQTFAAEPQPQIRSPWSDLGYGVCKVAYGTSSALYGYFSLLNTADKYVAIAEKNGPDDSCRNSYGLFRQDHTLVIPYNIGSIIFGSIAAYSGVNQIRNNPIILSLGETLDEFGEYLIDNHVC